MRMKVLARSPLALAGGAAAVAGLLTLGVLMGTGVLGVQGGKVADDVGQLVAGILAAAMCIVAGVRSAGVRRVAWGLIAMYCALWAISVVTWLVYDLTAGTQMPFPSLSAVGFVAAVPFAVAGSAAFSIRRGSQLPLVVRVLDAVTVGLALMLICWVPILERVFVSSRFTAGSALLSLSIPVGDLLVVTLLWSAVASSRWRLRPSMIVLGVGFLSVTIADLALAYASANGTFASGTLTDLMWTGGLLLLAAGALLDVPDARRAEAAAEPLPPRRLAIWVPFACAIVAAGISVADFHGTGPSIDPVVLGGVLVIMVLATVRQLLEAVSNRTLIVELRRRANTDVLTGLVNRDSFRGELDRAVLRGQQPNARGTAILYIDLDKFKSVNDRYGHAAGDRVLSVVARRLTGVMRPTDVVSRLGGDEFAIIAFNTSDRDSVAHIAYRVQGCFREPIAFAGDRMTLSAAIGGVLVTGGIDADAALRSADLALYAAKARGRGTFEIYDDALHGDEISRMWLEADMPESLAQGQFTLQYQPTISAESGAINGAEALVRWDHPTRGRIAPLDFIPVAEASGFIVDLGRWILQQALRDAASWRTHGVAPAVSVNVTVQQLRSAGFVDDVYKALADTRTAPENLILELTESSYVHEAGAAAAAIRDLRREGVRIAIDDFGTGYSSLALLTRLDADILKVDRSFVVNATSSAGRLVFKTVVDLARELHLSTTVEGIETPEEAALVRSLGADTLQGFHFDRPLDPLTFRQRLHHVGGSERHERALQLVRVPA